LLKRQRDAEAGRPSPATRTLGEVVGEYLRYKADQGKRSLREDTCILKRGILPTFGADLSVRKLTGAAIAQYERQRAGQVSAFTVANELTVLRHMLCLARRWGYVEQVPDIEMPKKPEGRRFEAEDIARLPKACGDSKNPYLQTIVTVALNTGIRKVEILGLEWARVDLASGRLTLYKTKSGKPRGVPDDAGGLRRAGGRGTSPGGTGGARVQAGRWRRVGPGAHGLQRSAQPSRHHGLPVPRSTSYLRLALRHAGGAASRRYKRSWGTPTTR
jgi:integrase